MLKLIASRRPHSLAFLAIAPVLGLLALSPARADEAGYVGTWASDLGQCKADQDSPDAPMIVAKDHFDQHEAHCTFKSIDGKGPDWKVAAECTVEGSAQPYDFTFTVSGDTLTVTDDTGGRDLLKCK